MKRESAWLQFFQGMGHEVFYDERDGTEGIPESWCAFWTIDDRSLIDEHPYLRVVRRLARIFEVWEATEVAGGGGARHDEQCLRYLQFMQGVDEMVSTIGSYATKLRELRESGDAFSHATIETGPCPVPLLQASFANISKFIWRLENRDVKALVVYGWFMAILTYVDHWWCRLRAYRECTAIVRYLDETYGAELEQWLKYMAKAVEYDLKGRLIDNILSEL